ncbi:MAG TPA: type VI secretion system ATPase TssH, partial [Leucothrix mucor]|nr:type VI secretion system ATPase TssH [Leucothrix mucor]
MRTDKLTSKFQLALQDAQSLALGKDHQFIEPVHLLIALLDQEGGIARSVLSQTGVRVDLLRSQLGEALESMPSVSGGDNGEIHVSNDLSRLLNATDKLSQKRDDQYISSELFLLAALDDKGKVGTLLKEMGAMKEALEMSINNVRGGQSVDDPNAEDQREALKKYTIDLTERAEQGKIDPIIGRDE